eukprot:711454-Rhodomonas_salina.1
MTRSCQRARFLEPGKQCCCGCRARTSDQQDTTDMDPQDRRRSPDHTGSGLWKTWGGCRESGPGM